MSKNGELPIAEFGAPGQMRDALITAILSGQKTTTSSLVQQYAASDEPLPQAGVRWLLMDSHSRGVGVIETVAVDVMPLAEVPLQHAIDEGEGFTTVAQWRAAHESYWRSPQLTQELGHAVQLDDDTPVVLERFLLRNIENPWVCE
ncbi:ASCH domain-containing protein [Nesterenkonia aerolata]|uniref:ASCH domain-containing protein n=1 Tax=Nesterenkonia aerolata TaxID=3074079 RepID=A0ABU2DS30_9MICC|nr:ASCH domain-containing protein [Nesterenkonia sp. LY-0111]MDR8019317.1 ASCH domain-containing protein [Nesterenkonia sp. LY-0111]